MNGQAHASGPAARAVGTLLAPVVACLRGDDEGYALLVGGALEDGTAEPAVRAAPKVARVYLQLAPPPDGSQHIVHTYLDAARERFERGVVRLGAHCLAVADTADELAGLGGAVFHHLAMEHGERSAFEGAVASVWWAAGESARLRDVDPIEEAAVICRYAARVA
jgi:hypothetical protein